MASGSGRGERGKSVINAYDLQVPYYPCPPENAEFNPFESMGVPVPPMMQPDYMETQSVEDTGAGGGGGGGISMTETECAGSNQPQPQPKPKTSNIWEHFHQGQNECDKGTNKFFLKCRHCPLGKGKYVWKTGEGYGSMRKHLEDRHPELAGIPTNQKKISSYGTGAKPFIFDVEKYKDALARFISMEHLSFSFAERLGLIELLKNFVNPQAISVSRRTIKRRIEKLYNLDKGKLVTNFRYFNGSVHIGSDIWTDHWRKHSYMGITCHWIDEEWHLQKRILAYRVFDDRHTAQNIARLISSILEEYGLKNKIFSIGFDNASANTASLPDLIKMCKPSFGGKFFHVRCACHVLNLCVQAGLEILNVFLVQIKSAIQYLWGSQKKMNEWLQFCKARGVRGRRFSRDCPTRWNSTYTLLNETTSYKEHLTAFIRDHADDINLYTSSWDVCEKILDVLEVFNSATFTLSGVYYPTTHLFMIEAINIVGILDVNPFEPRDGEDEDAANTRMLVCKAMEVMRHKWLAYFEDIPMIYLVACVFDPRVKLEGLSDYLVAYQSSAHIIDYNLINCKVDEVKKQIIDLHNEFYGRYNVNVDVDGSSSSTPDVDESKKRGWKVLFGRRKNKAMMGTTNCNELETYLGMNFELDEQDDASFDLLAWWKRHTNTYPILSMVAKQILGTPCSTVAVEQAFSAGGNILDETRSKMEPASLEMQTCLDDWTKALHRQQEIDKASFEFFDDEGGTTTTATEAET